MINFLIVFIAFLGLIILHEFSHFILAKKIGVKVEEFGIGYPPKIFGKKVGDTLYSLNLLPFGAFVRIEGEEGEGGSGPSNFRNKGFWQKFSVIAAGVVSFWIIAAVLLTIVMAVGVPESIDDEEAGNFSNPKIQIYAIMPNSPALASGLRIGDAVMEVSSGNNIYEIKKTKDFQDLIAENKGKEIGLKIKRGEEILNFSVIPRIAPPKQEGPLGVAVVRTAIKYYPWYLAPWEGIKTTGSLTWRILEGWGQALSNIFQHKPSGVELMGPIGIFDLFIQASHMGVSYFLQFVAIIAVNVALFNVIPIPVTDGGKIMFLIIEKIRKKQISRKFEERLNIVFFALIILLSIVVAIGDIKRIF
jgi:regulator of sigma E protease